MVKADPSHGCEKVFVDLWLIFLFAYVDFVGPQVMQCDRPNTDKDGFIYTNQPEEYINWKVCTYSIINFSTVYREGNCDTIYSVPSSSSTEFTQFIINIVYLVFS